MTELIKYLNALVEAGAKRFALKQAKLFRYLIYMYIYIKIYIYIFLPEVDMIPREILLLL